MASDIMSSDAAGRLVYLAEQLTSMHAAPDMAWLTGRFEFIGENAVGASLTLLARPDASECYRAERGGTTRTANARALREDLHIDELSANQRAARIFAEVAADGRTRTYDVQEMFEDAVTSLAKQVVVAPIAHNRETLGAGVFVLPEPSELSELMAGLLCQHAGVAIFQLREREEARRLHSTDPRLWVPDEDFLLAQVRREVVRARRYGREVGVALLRVENERDVRQRFGSFYADHMMRRIGAQLMSIVRDSDVVGALDGAFAVIHAETAMQGTQISAGRLRDRVLEMVQQRFPEAPSLDVSVSVVAYPESGSTLEDLLHGLLGEAAERYIRAA